MFEELRVEPPACALVEGRKAVVGYMSTVSGTRAGDPEPQTMDLTPNLKWYVHQRIIPAGLVMAWKGTLFLTHLPAF